MLKLSEAQETEMISISFSKYRICLSAQHISRCPSSHVDLCSRQSFFHVKEINAASDVLLFYKSAGIVVAPKRPQEWRLYVTLIMHAHNLFDGIRSLFRVVEGDS